VKIILAIFGFILVIGALINKVVGKEVKKDN